MEEKAGVAPGWHWGTLPLQPALPPPWPTWVHQQQSDRLFPQMIGLLERLVFPSFYSIYIFIYISYVTKLNTVCLCSVSNERLITFLALFWKPPNPLAAA